MKPRNEVGWVVLKPRSGVHCAAVKPRNGVGCDELKPRVELKCIGAEECVVVKWGDVKPRDAAGLSSPPFRAG